MTVEQLALDLWAPARQDFADRHQLGHIRLPRDTAGGDKAGDLVPAWRCCACGGIELSRYFLDLSHNCCGHTFVPSCQNPPNRPPSPYRMDAHWIPPQGWSRP